MSNDNNIDKLFRDNLYHRDFEFDQKHWESAEKLIETEEKKRRNWLGGKISLIAIGIAFVAGFLILNYQDNENEVQLTDRVAYNEAAEPPVGSAEEKQIAESSNKPEPFSSEKSPDQPAKSSHEIKATSKSVLNRLEANSGHSDETGSGIEVHNYPGNVTRAGEESAKTARKEFKNTIASNDADEYEPVVSGNVTAMQAGEKNIEGGTTAVLDEVTAQNKNITTDKGDFSAKKENSAPETQEAASGTEKGEILEKEQKTDNVMAETDPETEILVPAVITLNKETSPQELKTSAEVDKKEKEAGMPLKDRLNWLRHISLGVSGGVNISQGFVNTGNARAGLSAEPVGGLRIAYQVNQQVDIETGLLYDSRSGLNSKITSLVSRDLSTNKAYYSSNTTLSLYYIDLPLNLTYKYGKHSFIVGMQYAHLINTRNKITDTKEENGVSAVEKTVKGWSKNDGRFSSFDLAGIFGYEYAITDRLKVCGRYNYGLFDVTDDSSFGNSVRDKNNQFRVMIDYRFMKY